MEDTQNHAPGTATMHEAAKLNVSVRRQDTQSVTKRFVRTCAQRPFAAKTDFSTLAYKQSSCNS